jgi:hypothetical protein
MTDATTTLTLTGRHLPSSLVEAPTLQNRETRLRTASAKHGLHQPRLIKLRLADFAISEALDDVIVHHSDRTRLTPDRIRRTRGDTLRS